MRQPPQIASRSGQCSHSRPRSAFFSLPPLMPFDPPQFAAALAILFVAAFVRGMFGFGDAMFAMPLLSLVVGVHTATPLIAMCAATIATLILLRERAGVDLKSVGPVILAALVGIPLGVYGLTALPEALVKGMLGVIVISFAVFSLSHLELPELKNTQLGYVFGLVAGVLGGAYNTQGPALVIYATMRRWPRDEFRANLQSILLPTCAFILVNHWWQGLWKPPVFWLYGASLPILLVAPVLGRLVSKRVPQRAFARCIYVLLIVVGLILLGSTAASWRG